MATICSLSLSSIACFLPIPSIRLLNVAVHCTSSIGTSVYFFVVLTVHCLLDVVMLASEVRPARVRDRGRDVSCVVSCRGVVQPFIHALFESECGPAWLWITGVSTWDRHTVVSNVYARSTSTAAVSLSPLCCIHIYCSTRFVHAHDTRDGGR